MNASQAQVVHTPADDTVLTGIAGRFFSETIGSVAVIALAIAALRGFWASNLAAIATIVLAAALLIESGAFSPVAIEGGQWASSGVLVAVAGVILGVLALLGIAPGTLLSAAVIGFGGGFLFSLRAEANFGSRAMAGVAAIVLGILAVVGLNQTILVLVALLSLGAVELINGVSDSARLALSRRGIQHSA